MSFSFHVSPIHIDGIAHGLKGIKGYSQRKNDLQRRKADGYMKVIKQRLEVIYKKTGVFEETQYGEIDKNA